MQLSEQVMLLQSRVAVPGHMKSLQAVMLRSMQRLVMHEVSIVGHAVRQSARAAAVLQSFGSHLYPVQKAWARTQFCMHVASHSSANVRSAGLSLVAVLTGLQ